MYFLIYNPVNIFHFSFLSYVCTDESLRKFVFITKESLFLILVSIVNRAGTISRAKVQHARCT